MKSSWDWRILHLASDETRAAATLPQVSPDPKNQYKALEAIPSFFLFPHL